MDKTKFIIWSEINQFCMFQRQHMLSFFDQNYSYFSDDLLRQAVGTNALAKAIAKLTAEGQKTKQTHYQYTFSPYLQQRSLLLVGWSLSKNIFKRERRAVQAPRLLTEKKFWNQTAKTTSFRANRNWIWRAPSLTCYQVRFKATLPKNCKLRSS